MNEWRCLERWKVARVLWPIMNRGLQTQGNMWLWAERWGFSYGAGTGVHESTSGSKMGDEL